VIPPVTPVPLARPLRACLRRDSLGCDRRIERGGGTSVGAVVLGREAEIAFIDEFIKAIPEAAIGLLLEGEAGIGKTVLWQATVEAAVTRSYGVLRCRPAKSERRFAFAALRDLLERVPNDDLSELPSPQRHALEVALLRAEQQDAPPGRNAVALALLGLMRALARAAPLVAAIDDVQWVDGASAAALTFAIRRLTDEPVGILVTRRARGGDLPLGLAELEPRTARLALGPLALEPLDHLLRARADAALPRPLLVQVHQTCGGNPFYAMEIARALARLERPLRAGEPLPVSDSLGKLVGERLGRLPPEVHDVLAAVAAVARPTLPVVDAALGRGSRAKLAKAVEAGVVELEDERIRFTHPLLATVLYSALPIARRRLLHRRLARGVADAEEHARHLALAAERPSAAVAAALDEAARSARVRGAPAAAGDLAEQAYGLTPPRASADARRRLLVAAGYHLEAGDTGRARDRAQEAVAASTTGSERAEALNRLGQIHWYSDFRIAARLFREALEERVEDLALRAESELGLSQSLFVAREDVPRALAHAQAALTAAETGGDPVVLSQALTAHGLIAGFLGDPSAVPAMERALAMEQASLSLRVLRHPTYLLAIVLLYQDRFDEARTLFEVVWERARQRGDENAIAWIAFHLSTLELLVGEWSAAGRWAEEGYEAALQTGQAPLRAVLLAARALLDAHLGRADEARQRAAEALAIGERTGIGIAWTTARWAAGLLELSLGAPEEALEHFGALAESTIATGTAEPGVMRFVPDQVEALIGAGRLGEAETLLDRHEALAAALDRPSPLAACSRCRALLLAERGDLADALTSVERAIAQHDRLTQPFERARTLLAKGTLLRRSRQKGEARTTLQEATAIFERLDAALWTEKARAEARRIGGRAAVASGLSQTERQIADLVVAGRTNDEVARALHLSAKTVAWNLSKIYRKLGIRSRTQLGRALDARQ
jgi:DNA-binding CsgD family transcriptional regulator